ncbi:uncharacterized protein LOC143268269 [Peromyscus maniculatus bairdii]|uniref:uncharacterized protein LOC143268269 n=1 Tax=Peromyscus maniculatus bairdii TaxID=230844 RepID=UPI003FD4B0CD
MNAAQNVSMEPAVFVAWQDRVAFLKRSRFYTGHAVCTTFSTALKHGRRRVLPYSPSRLRESFSCRGRTPVNRGGCALPYGEVETLLPKPQSQVAKLWEAESTSCWWIPNEAIPPHISSLPVTVAGVRNPGFL